MGDFESHLAGWFQKIFELEHFLRVLGTIWVITALSHETRMANKLLSKRTSMCAIIHHCHCPPPFEAHTGPNPLSAHFFAEMLVTIWNRINHIEKKSLVIKPTQRFLFQISSMNAVLITPNASEGMLHGLLFHETFHVTPSHSFSPL